MLQDASNVEQGDQANPTTSCNKYKQIKECYNLRMTVLPIYKALCVIIQRVFQHFTCRCPRSIFSTPQLSAQLFPSPIGPSSISPNMSGRDEEVSS